MADGVDEGHMNRAVRITTLFLNSFIFSTPNLSNEMRSVAIDQLRVHGY